MERRQPADPIGSSRALIAIAITLLIIEVHVPHLPHGASNLAWGQALVDRVPEFSPSRSVSS